MEGLRTGDELTIKKKFQSGVVDRYFIPMLLTFFRDGQNAQLMSLFETPRVNDIGETTSLLFSGGLAWLDLVGFVSAIVLTIIFLRVRRKADFSVLEIRGSFFRYQLCLVGMFGFHVLATLVDFFHVEVSVFSLNIGAWLSMIELSFRIKLSWMYCGEMLGCIKKFRKSLDS